MKSDTCETRLSDHHKMAYLFLRKTLFLHLRILKGTKTNYFNNLNPKVITDNKKFWSAVKPLFSDKSKAMNAKVLCEKRKIIKNYKMVSEVINILQT